MAELIWDGKYDAHGNKRAPVRIELPFQTVETVNESVQERQRTLELSSSGHDPEWRNRLIWGDKKYVLPSLLPEFAGKVDLIYIDPPFDTGADFSFSATVPDRDGEPDGDETFIKEPSILEQKAYRDTWGRGLESYVHWLYEAVELLHDLLADNGSMYLHIEPDIGNYARVILDEVFGGPGLRTEIAWKRTSSHGNVSRSFGEIWESIFFYSKSPTEWTWNQQYVPFEEDYVEKHFTGRDANGRLWTTSDLVNPGLRPNLRYEYRGYKPHRNGWKITLEKMEELDAKGRLYFPTDLNGRIRLKRYLDESPGQIAQNFWTDIAPINSQAHEAVGYQTQKPEALLRRIVKTSSNESDLVLDCFIGSGTTAMVAEKLNRRWIACDLGRFAIHTTRKRLLGIPGVKPFVVQNLGKYERQQWQVAEFAPNPVILSEGVASRSEATPKSKDPMPAGAQHQPGREFSARTSARGANPSTSRLAPQANMGPFDSAAGSLSRTDRSAQDDRLREQRQREENYRKFILELYHATPVSGHAWLHGVKAGRMVHVAAVDAPVTRADVNAIAAEVWKAAGKGADSPQKPAVDILGWEFALELNETAKEVAAQARVDAAFKKIPREVLEKKAVEQGDVHFFELGALSVETKIKKRELTLTLSDFVIPLDDVPAEVRSAIKHWSQMVDYWAVDWDFKEDTFHNQWQSYRTRKNPKLDLSVKREYPEPGHYTVVVKVIDILGNDTTKTLTVEMK